MGYSSIAAAVAVNTTIAAAAGTLSCLFIVMLHQYFALGVVTWDLLIAGNGALAGLVSITGPAAFVQTWAALLIGLTGGGVYYASSIFNLRVLKVRPGAARPPALLPARPGRRRCAEAEGCGQGARSAMQLACVRLRFFLLILGCCGAAQVDDPVDAIAVHAACGVWGMLASAAFADAGMVGAWFGDRPGAGDVVSGQTRSHSS